jgi:hypothetical protein
MMFSMNSHSNSMTILTHIRLTPLLILKPFREADASEMEKSRSKGHFRGSQCHCIGAITAVDCDGSGERTRAFLTQGAGRLPYAPGRRQEASDLQNYFLVFECV